MILGTGCLGARALDGDSIRAALFRLGLDQVLLAVTGQTKPRDLDDLQLVGLRCSWEERTRTLELARAARCDRMLVDLPADVPLETCCRLLHDFARRAPGLRLAVLTPSAGALAQPEALEYLLDDLAALPLGYWHVPSRCRLLGQPDHAWLDRLGRRAQGALLDDVADGRGGLPPGTGELPLAELVEQLRGLSVAVDVDPLPDVGLLRMAIDTLRRLGLA